MLFRSKGVRLLIIPECDDENNLNGAFVKLITGNDDITSRNLHEKMATYEPQMTTYIICNNKPKIGKLDGGLERRIIVLPYLYSFVDNPRKPREKMKDENMGDVILTQEMRMEFMMLLLETAYANKDITNIDKPEDIKNATDDYITELNSIGGWIQDTLEITGIRGDSIKRSEEHTSELQSH